MTRYFINIGSKLAHDPLESRSFSLKKKSVIKDSGDSHTVTTDVITDVATDVAIGAYIPKFHRL